MADYIDNDTIHHQLQHQDDGSDSILVGTIGGGFSINLNDDLDAPLLEEQIGGGTLNITPCLCGQPGFQNVTQLMSDTLNSRKAQRKLIMATSLCFVFMIGELIGGYIAGSLAIMTDAAHLLSDCISFIVSLLAIWLSRKPADNRMSFGYKRAEILGAIISILGIWLLTIFLFYLAVNRLIDNDFEIDANTMMIVSGIGILINIIMAYILHGSCDVSSHGHSHSVGGHGHSHLINSNKQHSHNHNHNNNIDNSNNYHQLQHNSGGTQSTDPATFVINNRIDRNNSICSYRSPSHSRTNSFSINLPNSINNNNNNNSNINNQVRRSSSNSSLMQFKLQEAVNNRVNNTVSNSSRMISSDNEHHHYRDSSDVDSSIMMITTNNYQHNNIITNNNNIHHSHSQHNASCNSHSHHNHQINQNNNNNNNNNNNDSINNINIRAAVIHVLGDFIQSIGVFLAAIIIKLYPSAKIADPICTFFFSILVIFTTFRIMKESISIILDAVPQNIDYGNVINEFGCISGVVSVHHLNIWNLTMDWPILSVHLIIDQFSNADKILHIANNIAKNKFNIKHVTIQIEKHIEIFDGNHP